MEPKTSTTQIALKWGLILAVASIIITTISYMLELWKNSWVSFAVGLVPMVALLVLAHKEFKSENGGFMSYGQGLGIAMLMGAISSIVTSSYNYIYGTFIDTNLMEKIKSFQIEKMEEQGLTDQQIDGAVEMMSKFQSPGITFMIGIFGGLLATLIVGLIVSAITKKNRPVFE